VTDSKKGAARPPKAKRHHRQLGRDIERLPCQLTQDELLDRGQKLAQVGADLATHRAHADQVKKELRARESQLEADRAFLENVVRSKQEPRDVEIAAYLGERPGHVDDVRLDTGEVVRSRPAREGELQGRLPLNDESAP
jgi:hypothetical protein